jgi:hypothetical protein
LTPIKEKDESEPQLCKIFVLNFPGVPGLEQSMRVARLYPWAAGVVTFM